MPSTWNAEAEVRLLLGILAQVQGARLDYKALAAHMGPDCTVPALHQHICKLRREAGIPLGSPQKTRGVKSATGTPKTPTKTPKGAASESPTKRGKRAYCVIDDDSEEEDEKMDIKHIIKDENVIKDEDEKVFPEEKEPQVVDLID